MKNTKTNIEKTLMVLTVILFAFCTSILSVNVASAQRYTSGTNEKTITMPTEKDYNDPEFGASYVWVEYKYKLSNEDGDDWAKALIGGFVIDAKYASGDDILGVLINFYGGKSVIYGLSNKYYKQFAKGKITVEELCENIYRKDLSDN